MAGQPSSVATGGRPANSRPHTPEPGDSSGSRDNIKVAVRIRPLSEKETSRGDRAAWGTDGTGGVGLLSPGGDQLSVKFAYDLVFGTSTTNEQVFDQVSWPAIEPVLTGISGTVFAYGVTSSGKTHTMMGSPSDLGVVPRAITALFNSIRQTPDRVFTVKLSMLEIYCEMLNDLLDPTKLNLDIHEREGAGRGGSVLVVKGLTEAAVGSAEEALTLIQQGQDNRKVASTAFNDQSSRSHTICRLMVESSPRQASNANTAGPAAAAAAGSTNSSFTAQGTNPSSSSSSSVVSTSAWLTLVDLAGSEGAKAALSKDQQAEARDINRSLLTLGKVMYELAKGGTAGHLPFRDSLLTRLLKPSLTGCGARVAIICNVTPASSQSDETWNTLRFADGAKRIKVAAVKNEALDIAAVVAQYQQEVATLKAQLAALSGAAASAGGGLLSPDVLQSLQHNLDNSSRANAADQLEDMMAQLAYLQECLSLTTQERGQLLIINKKITGMLVEQFRADGAVAAAAAGGGGSSGTSSSSNSNISGIAGSGSSSSCCVAAVRPRRCLSWESISLYNHWQGSSADPQQQQQQQAVASASAPQSLEMPGLDCNAADAAEVQELLRITEDELPDSITNLQQPCSEQKQQQQQQEPQKQQQQQDAGAACGSPFAAAAGGDHHQDGTCSVTCTPQLPLGGAACLDPAEAATGGVEAAAAAAAAVAQAASAYPRSYRTAVSITSICSTRVSAAGPACSATTAASLPAVAPAVPCSIYFPGSRRTSKTLALVAPGGCGGGAPQGSTGRQQAAGEAAGWLGSVGVPVVLLPGGAISSSWSCSQEAEARRKLATQEARLELLLQQLTDKEALLAEARELQAGQELQLRLTITAADRALLRDKLAEAEQQLTAYQSALQECKAENHELIHMVEDWANEYQKLAQQHDATAAELAQLKRHSRASLCSNDSMVFGPVPVTAAGPASGAASGACSGLNRSSSSNGIPEVRRIPLPPGLTAAGGSFSSLTCGANGAIGSSVINSSRSRSVGSGPRAKSAAAAATFNNIRATMAAAAAAGASSSGSRCATPPGISPRALRHTRVPSLNNAGHLSSIPDGSAAGGSGGSTPRTPRSPGGTTPSSLSRNESFSGSNATAAAAQQQKQQHVHQAAASVSPKLAPAPITGSMDGSCSINSSNSSSTDGNSKAQQQQQQQEAFHPICITSPFANHTAASGSHRTSCRSSITSGSSVRPSDAEGAFTGSSSRSEVGHQPPPKLSGSPTAGADRTSNTSPLSTTSAVGATALLHSGYQTMSVLQTLHTSRIPLPPSLQQHANRIKQHQQQMEGPQPALDRYLLGLHVKQQGSRAPGNNSTTSAAAAAGTLSIAAASSTVSAASSSPGLGLLGQHVAGGAGSSTGGAAVAVCLSAGGAAVKCSDDVRESGSEMIAAVANPTAAVE